MQKTTADGIVIVGMRALSIATGAETVIAVGSGSADLNLHANDMNGARCAMSGGLSLDMTDVRPDGTTAERRAGAIAECRRGSSGMRVIRNLRLFGAAISHAEPGRMDQLSPLHQRGHNLRGCLFRVGKRGEEQTSIYFENLDVVEV